ncbi:substrate-binding domain-containing protein [Agathobacter sp.]
MLKKNLQKTMAAIAMVATMITGCSQGTTNVRVDGLNSLGKINIISREEESGTRNVFAQKLGILDETTGKDKIADQCTVADSNEAAYEKAADDKSAIAYVSSGVDLDESKVKSITVTGSDMTRSFYLAYKGEMSDVEEDFIRYIKSEGQKKVSEKYTTVADPATFLSDKAEGKIKIGGSTSVAPLVEELADEYMKLNSNATITVIATDSGNGLSGAMEGTYDIGMSSRELKSYEDELLTKVEIAKDEVHVIVNKDNPIERITIDQLADIYTGKVTEWSQLNATAEEK